MKKILLLLAILAAAYDLQAQVDITKGWKFKTGDNMQWATAGFNDAGWPGIQVGHFWEDEGYKDYDGYGWYRLHVIIPSALKDSSYLKGDLKIELGKIDDGDQVFLNGGLIGTNAGRSKDITKGSHNVERIYTVPLNSPAIHWDKENVIAVRVYDRSGNGGMYEGNYNIRVADINDIVNIDHQSHAFSFTAADHLQKEIMLTSGNSQYSLSGTLHIAVNDPFSHNNIWEQSVQVKSFSATQPFSYTYSFQMPAQQSYQVTYTFTESHSGKSITDSEGVPYILTPRPSARPHINGATVTGVRPGHPFLFKIPVSGAAPIKYKASGLPKGLSLDAATGVISGKMDNRGTYTVHLTVANKAGRDTRDLKIVVGDQIALTPAMGWNSWNCWGLSVSDEKVRAAADAMKNSGLIDHGWTYINIDDGWERETRSADGEIVSNAKFPDMKKMTDYVHHLGLKVGIYSSPGDRTCGGYLGSYQHEAQDAATYAQWGIDYLKYDWCSYRNVYPHPTLEEMKKPYKLMRACLDKADRDILFSFCQYGMGEVWQWGGETGGNSWRTTGDITDTWNSMSGIGFNQDKCAPYAKPGNWNDPDMLVVGKVGWGPSLHNTRLTPDEQYTHISLWCLLSAPLLIGCDMSQLDDFTLNLLSNDEVLAIDQDALGREAMQVTRQGDLLVYEKELADGSKAIGIFNTGSEAVNAALSFSDLQLSGRQVFRDLWRQKEIGTFNKSFTAKNIPSHGVLLLKTNAAK